MKIRVTGTKAECEHAAKYYQYMSESPDIKYVSVSELYPNRGSNQLFRVYIDIEYYTVKN